MKTQAIVPTAGIGARFKSSVLKSLVLLNGKPLFIYCLQVLDASKKIDSIILVVPKDHITEFEKQVRKYRLRKVTRIIAGGETRALSVLNGLKVIDEDTDVVLVHDGARPFLTEAIVEGSITLCYTDRAVVVGVPVKPTIKRVNPESLTVKDTLDRKELWEIQTPQVFKKEILVRAYELNSDNDAPDESAIVEKSGVHVKVMKGDYDNIKITTQDDINLALAILQLREK